MLKLYYAPGTISVATAIALYEADLPFEPVLVDFARAEQTQAPYHAINPKGRVPALETERGILTETGALLDYIAQVAPRAGLVPADPYAAAKMREAMYYLASTMHVNHAHKMRGARWADSPAACDDMAAKVPETMTASCAHVETQVLQGTYVLGDRFSLADPWLYMISTWLDGDGVDTAGFPKLTAFMAAMAGRRSVRRVAGQGMLRRATP